MRLRRRSQKGGVFKGTNRQRGRKVIKKRQKGGIGFGALAGGLLATQLLPQLLGK